MGKRTVVLEIQTMLERLRIPGGYQVAKTIVDLAQRTDLEFKNIGPNRRGMKRPMSVSEAKRIVAEAERRIALADAPD